MRSSVMLGSARLVLAFCIPTTSLVAQFVTPLPATRSREVLDTISVQSGFAMFVKDSVRDVQDSLERGNLDTTRIKALEEQFCETREARSECLEAIDAAEIKSRESIDPASQQRWVLPFGLPGTHGRDAIV